MERVYFKADKDISKKLVDEWSATQESISKLTTDIMKEYGADGLITDRDCLLGIAYEIQAPESGKWPKIEQKTGFRGTVRQEGDKWYIVYSPDKRRKEGKHFARLQDSYHRLRHDNPSFSDFIVNKFGLHRWVSGPHDGSRTGMALYYSGAGVAKGVLVVQVPCDDQHPAPEVPEFFTRIKKSEYIALAEE